MAFYCDSLFALQIHIVQNLIVKISFVQSLRCLQQTVGQCAFAVINMGNYAKISYILHFLSAGFS
jgi:hypothetical protein